VRTLYGRFQDLVHEAARFGVVGLAGLVVTDGGANLLQCGAGGARRETVLFFTVNAIGVGISEGCVGIALALGLNGRFSYNVALNGGIALATLFRYWSYKKWVWPTATTASDQAGLAVQLSCVALTVFVLGQHAAPAYLAALSIGTGLAAAIQFWSCREWVWPARLPAPTAARPVRS
jgi:putative flippase GtrA